MIHNIYGVELADTVPVVLGATESQNVRSGNEVKAEPTSGGIFPQHVAIVSQIPVADFGCYAIADALNQVGIVGLSIADLANGLNLYAYKHADGGGRSVGTTHRKYNFKKGLIVPSRISCEHRGDAMISYNVLPTWDGTNDPLVESDAVAVPAIPTDDERFSIGKVTIGGAVLGDIRSFELDFGVNARTEGGDSDIFDTHASIFEMLVTLTLRGVDVEWLKSTNIPRAGKAGTHANSSFYLRKRSQSAAGFLSDVTAAHIKGTMAGMAVVEDAFSGIGECSVKLTATYDGTNLPVAFTTASAIT